MNEIPKVVFSSTLTDPEWRETRVVAGDVGERIAELKAEDGKPILLHGGASFARSLADRGLIDEYRLLVHPIALGEGLPLFGARTRLRLTNTRTFSTGIIASTLVPA
jgi:dihydrofolate reductase